jgi:pyruvate dehydrogenase E2 component (dihydrolipoamide acetyltransferase)
MIGQDRALERQRARRRKWLLFAGGAAVGLGAAWVMRNPFEAADALGNNMLRMQGAKTHEVPWPGGTVRYVMVGSGDQPMVIVHGFSDSPASWARVTKGLLEKYRICMPVLPGHPGTTCPDNLQLGHAVQAVDAAILRAFGGRQVHLVGHSLGGWVCALYAAAATERVASLTLINPAGLEERIDTELLLPRSVEQARRTLIGAVGPIARRVPRMLLDGYLRSLRRRVHPAVVRMMAESPQADEALGRIQVPTRIIAGTADRMVPVELSRYASVLVDGSTLEEIPGGSHSPHISDVATMRRLLAETASA